MDAVLGCCFCLAVVRHLIRATQPLTLIHTRYSCSTFSKLQVNLCLAGSRKRALAGKSCAELVFDEYLEGLWSVKDK